MQVLKSYCTLESSGLSKEVFTMYFFMPAGNETGEALDSAQTSSPIDTRDPQPR